MITAQAPVLLVSDVVESANWFRDRLGFSYEKFWGDPPSFCMVIRDEQVVMLSQVPEGDEIVPNWKVVDKMWNVYFWVDDVEDLYREVQERGAPIDYELYDTPYGCREFGTQTPDGHDIAFGQVLDR